MARMIPPLLPSLCLAGDCKSSFLTLSWSSPWPVSCGTPEVHEEGQVLGKLPLSSDSWKWPFTVLGCGRKQLFPAEDCRWLFKLVWSFLGVAMGGGMRDYGCWRSGGPQNLNHPLLAGWGELGRLWVFVEMPVLLTCCRVASPPCALEEALHQHPEAAQRSVVMGTHMFSSHGQVQKSSFRPLSHFLVEELKQWQTWEIEPHCSFCEEAGKGLYHLLILK